jgi:hypothetical protein
MVDFAQILQAIQDQGQQRNKLIGDMQNIISQPQQIGGGPNEEFMRQLFAPPADMDEEELIIRDWKDFTTQFKSNPQFRDMMFAFGAALAQGGDDVLGNLSKGLIAMKGIQEQYKEKKRSQALEDRQMKIQQGQAILQGRALDKAEAADVENRKLKSLELGLKGLEGDNQQYMQLLGLMFQNENLQINKDASKRAGEAHEKQMKILDLQLQNEQRKADRAGIFEISAGESPMSIFIKSSANEIAAEASKNGIEVKPSQALAKAMESAAKFSDNPLFGGNTNAAISANNIFSKNFQALLEEYKNTTNFLNPDAPSAEEANQMLQSIVPRAMEMTMSQLTGSPTNEQLSSDIAKQAAELGLKNPQIVTMNGIKVLKGTNVKGEVKYYRIKGE